MKIQISTNFSEARAKMFFRFHFLKRTKGKYVFYATAVLFLIIGALCFFIGDNLSKAGIGFLIASVTVLIVRPIMASKTAKKIVEASNVSGAKYIVVFYDDHFEYIIDGIITIYNWSDLICVCDTNTCLYFYVTNEKAITVPKYAIRGNERDNFLEFLKNNTKYKRYRFKQRDEE